MKVVFQGEPGAYSEVAARKMFGSRCRTIPVREFDAIFEAVVKGRTHRGVVPIENSLTGSIHENYDRLQQAGLKIVSETRLRIEHVLMCHACASKRSVREVMSHPQALSQCSRFFNRRKNMKPSLFYDTAGAAKTVAAQQSPLLAAIASSHAANIYKLKILQRNLENNHHNYTRFLGISRRENPKSQKGSLKSSIFFAPKKNETGVLFKMAGVFALRNVNLLKIESRPNPDRAFHYLFYLDFEGSPSEKRVEMAMEHLKEMSSVFQYFGSYPKGQRTFID